MRTASHSEWKTRLAAMAVAAFAAFVVALGIRWEFSDTPKDDAPPPPVASDSAVAPPVRETPSPLPGNDSSVRADARHLILTGTHVAPDPRDSLAFIGTDPRNPQIYAVNSMLVNGVRVREIARDHVLLERDGSVARVEIGGAWTEAPAAARRLTAMNMPATAFAQQPEPARPSLTDGLAISPVFDANGMLTSYRLRPGRHRGVFTRWGLEPGDQLVAIENAPLIDVDTAARQLELIGSGQRLDATILRNGVRMAVVLDGSAIAEEKTRAQAANESLISLPPS